MIDSLPPGAILIVGALVFPLLRGRLLQGWLLLLPVLSALHLLSIPHGTTLELGLFDYRLTPVRVDQLSLLWGYIFHLAAFLAALFSLHVRDRGQHTAAFLYVGSAVGAVFAGDLATLFVYWELTAVASVFLVWARRNERSYRAGLRYLIVQVGSGVILLAGIILRLSAGGSLEFGHLGLVDLPTALIFVAFGVKAAFPLLHNWVQDAYPEATVTGAVFLSAFTTKMAIYALARGFPGTELLIWLGAVMTIFPLFFAVIVNDLRRVLAYSLNNQLGFMVCGVGLASAGNELALSGTAAHAVAHILYKSLLFMSMGAVLHRTGTARGTDLGGLYKTMPWTAGFCIVGAISILAFPFTSGFVSKAMIMSSAAGQHHTVAWLALLFASAAAFAPDFKVPYFAFFAHDSGKRPKEAPFHMLLAMGITAALCILIGVFPGPLYSILPYPVDYQPYTMTHVVTQLQLLIFSALAFATLSLVGLYPPEKRSTVLDFDWSYRRALPALVATTRRVGGGAWQGILGAAQGAVDGALVGVRRLHGPQGVFARTWSTGGVVVVVVVALAVLLALYFTAGVG